MGNECCSNENRPTDGSQKESKKPKRMVESNLPALEKIDKNDKRVVSLNKKLDEVLASHYYGLEAFFKGLKRDKKLTESLRDIKDDSDAYYFPADEHLREGTIYKGEILYDQRHGFGVLMSDTGDFYIGQCENNKAQGLGFFMHR